MTETEIDGETQRKRHRERHTERDTETENELSQTHVKQQHIKGTFHWIGPLN